MPARSPEQIHALADATEPPFPDGVWSVAPSRSEIGFIVKDMWGRRTVRGVFGAYDGTLEMRAGGVHGELTIVADSLDTGNTRRDRHLRSPAFFDVGQHRRIVFTVTAVTPCDVGLMMSGEVAIRTSRVRLEIPVDAEQIDAGALRLEGSTTVSREAAGLAWNMLGMIRGDATLHARLTLERATT